MVALPHFTPDFLCLEKKRKMLTSKYNRFSEQREKLQGESVGNFNWPQLQPAEVSELWQQRKNLLNEDFPQASNNVACDFH